MLDGYKALSRSLFSVCVVFFSVSSTDHSIDLQISLYNKTLRGFALAAHIEYNSLKMKQNSEKFLSWKIPSIWNILDLKLMHR